jgi:phosphoribosylglycinamide formyltransferase-1
MIGKRIAVLVSGRGTNLAALVDAMRDRALGGTITRVISNPMRRHSVWHGRDVACTALDHRACATRDAFDTALALAIDGERPDLVVMAGFMRVLGAPLVRRYANRLINVPVALPSYPASTRIDGARGRCAHSRVYGPFRDAGGRCRPDHRAGGRPRSGR